MAIRIATRRNSLADVGVGGDKQDGQRREIFSRTLECFQAGEAGHPHIGNHHGDFLRPQNFQSAFAGINHDGFKILAG